MPTPTTGTEGPTQPPEGVGACAQDIPVTSQVPRLRNREYDNAIRDLLNVREINGRPPSGMLVDDLEGAITSTAWNGYLDAANAIAAQVMNGDARSTFISCDPAATDCLRTTVEQFGRKALRRPLTADEVDSYLRMAQTEPAGQPEEVAESILAAFLSTPSFIMVPELNQLKDDASGAFVLSDHEVATRLSLLLWGSIPDDALNAAADAGQLRTLEQIEGQAMRMVNEQEKVGAQLATFHRFYADVRFGAHWATLDHDTERFPLFDKDAVNPAMMDEIDAFFAEVAFTGGFKDLLLSNVAYVNNATAPIYGLNAADYGPELTRVELPATERPGFLTRVGFLSSYSRFDSTSPILRGAFINKHILGIDPGPPVDNVPTEPPPGNYATEREAVDALTSPSDCSGCHHAIINPPGYVMEVFDSIGGIQDTDPLGGPIDGVADVTLPEGIKTINSPYELMEAIAESSAPKLRYVQQWVAFATGRGTGDDACVVDTLGTAMADDSYTILNLLTDMSQADFMRLRTADL